MSDPWMKFYPADWRSDPALRLCSRAARGTWIDMLSIMHEAEPYGELRVNGIALDSKGLAKLLGETAEDIDSDLRELETNGVFSRRKNGVIYSRRMEKDENRRRKLRENGKKGGNPSLLKQTENRRLDNQQDKTTEARSQKPERKEKQEKETPQKILLTVLDKERAGAVLEHRKTLRKPLSVHASKLLAGKLSRCPDPNAAADTMIERGWLGVEPEWIAKLHNTGPPTRTNGAGVDWEFRYRKWDEEKIWYGHWGADPEQPEHQGPRKQAARETERLI